MEGFTINNAGAVVKGKNNGDGTYTVTTNTTRLGDKAKTELLTADEVLEKFGDKVNLKQDKFEKASLGSNLIDVAKTAAYITYEPYVTYNPVNIAAHYARTIQAIQDGDKQKAIESLLNTPNPYNLENPYL